MKTTAPGEAVESWLNAAFTTIRNQAVSYGAHVTGPPFARFRQLEDGLFAVEAGFPVDRILPGSNGIHAGVLPESDTITTTHVSRFTESMSAYEAIGNWLSEHRCEPDGDPWEVYFTDPCTAPDQPQWRTEVVQPCRPR